MLQFAGLSRCGLIKATIWQHRCRGLPPIRLAPSLIKPVKEAAKKTLLAQPTPGTLYQQTADSRVRYFAAAEWPLLQLFQHEVGTFSLDLAES